MPTEAVGSAEVTELELGDRHVRLSVYAAKVRPADPDGDDVHPIPVFVVKLERQLAGENQWSPWTETLATKGELAALFKGLRMMADVFGHAGLRLPETPRIPF